MPTSQGNGLLATTPVSGKPMGPPPPGGCGIAVARRGVAVGWRGVTVGGTAVAGTFVAGTRVGTAVAGIVVAGRRVGTAVAGTLVAGTDVATGCGTCTITVLVSLLMTLVLLLVVNEAVFTLAGGAAGLTTRTRMRIVTTSPGATSPIVIVTVVPATLITPLVVVALMSVTKLGNGSLTTTFWAAMVPAFVTVRMYSI